MNRPNDILDLFNVSRLRGAQAVDAMVADILRGGVPPDLTLGELESIECCIIARYLVRECPMPPGLDDVDRAIADRMRAVSDADGDKRRAAKYGGGDG